MCKEESNEPYYDDDEYIPYYKFTKNTDNQEKNSNSCKNNDLDLTNVENKE